MRYPRALLVFLTATTLSCIPAVRVHAQTASPVKSLEADAEKDDATIVLSPFVVNATDDQGFQATNTLAGTRLRSSLKDIASPISVFTPELLKNIAATNVQDALRYSINVENENEFAPDDGEGISISSTTQNRVRGLAAASPTRGFFKTNFRADTYNTDRMTVASGPNSILFGIGSPAGILDGTPIRASTARPVGEISFRTDNFKSHRATLDVGVPIVKDVLAVRFAELDQKMKTFRTPEYDDERRHFATLTYQPFKSTTIYASYEHMTNFRVRSRWNLMEDHVSDWIKLGKPLYDFTTDKWTFDKGATWIARPDLSGWTNIGSGDRLFMAEGALGGSAVQGLVWTGVGSSWDRTKWPGVSFKDDSIINSKTNYYGLGDRTQLSGRNYSVVLEQKIREDLYAEFAYNREKNVRNQDDPLRGGLSTIQADVNWYLPYASDAWGHPIPSDPVMNPNVGRYFVDSQYLGWKQHLDFETKRAMLSYNLNLAEKVSKWLGRYNFGAMWQQETTDDLSVKSRLTNQGSHAFGSLADGTWNSISSRYYLNLPALGGDSAGVEYPGPFQLPPWPSIVGGTWELPTKSRLVNTGKMFVGQGYLLNDDLVLTFGYRKDQQKVYSKTFGDRNPTTGEYLYNLPLDPTPIVQEGITRTYGAVYHTPLKWLSLLYNRSNAFNPQGNFRDWFNRPLPPGTGKTQDYGVMIDLFDSKLSLRLTRYDSSVIDTVEYDWYYEEPKWGAAYFLDASWGAVTQYAQRLAAETGDQSYLADVHDLDALITGGSDAVRATRDFKSKGYEMELFYRPTKQLDVRFTLAQSTSTSVRVVPGLREYTASRLAVWEKYFPYRAWGQWDTTITKYDDWRTNPNSLGYQTLNYDGAMPRLEAFKAEEGKTVTRGRKWRANLIANYRFDGRLKGFSVGGGGRWRSRDTIGYYGKPNPLLTDPSVKLLVSDLNRPIYGPEILVFDGWIGYERPISIAEHKCTWSVQLNIQNLLNDDKIEPRWAYTDGTITAYARNEPRAVIVSSSLRY